MLERYVAIAWTSFRQDGIAMAMSGWLQKAQTVAHCRTPNRFLASELQGPRPLSGGEF